ncbi:MAG: hypothetical protein ACKVXR_14025, partial [Planctomycetota bacterium]
RVSCDPPRRRQERVIEDSSAQEGAIVKIVRFEQQDLGNSGALMRFLRRNQAGADPRMPIYLATGRNHADPGQDFRPHHDLQLCRRKADTPGIGHSI